MMQPLAQQGALRNKHFDFQKPRLPEAETTA
jgi:hypothetical protein